MNELLKKLGLTLRDDGKLSSRMQVTAHAFVGFDGKQAAGELKAAEEKLDLAVANYQPNTREELEPQEDDYIYPVFRAISQILIPDRPLDLSKPGVLERAMPMLVGQTVYPNHLWDVEAWLGVVEDAWWDDPKKSGSDFSAPGINARYKIDWKSNPKIARGLLMKPPALHSTSISFWFDWEKSHPELNDGQFWSMLGEEVDGEMVRVIVVEILGFREVSIVYQGGDPEAKQIGEDAAKLSGAEMELSKESVFETSRLDHDEIGAGLDKTEHISGGKQMDEFLKAILATLQVETPEEAAERVKELANQAAPDANLVELGKQLEELKVEPGDAIALVTAGKSYREQLVGDLKKYAALALCNENQKLPDGFVESHSSGSIEQLKSHVELYRNKALDRLPGVCLDCGSHNVDGRSSIDESLQPEDEEGGQQKKRELDLSQIHK